METEETPNKVAVFASSSNDLLCLFIRGNMQKPIILPNTFNEHCYFCLKNEQSVDVHYVHKGRNAFVRICKTCAEKIKVAADNALDLVKLGIKPRKA